MEQLALCLPGRPGRDHLSEKAHLVGTLSLLEVIYRVSMEEVAAAAPLSEDVRSALVSRGGELGSLLAAAEMVERLEFPAAIGRLSLLGLTLDDLRLAQVKAYSWREGLQL